MPITMIFKGRFLRLFNNRLRTLGIFMCALVAVTYWHYAIHHAGNQVFVGYYHKLGQAFLAGQTYLFDKPALRFLSIGNPYKYGNRKGVDFLWDASLYDDRYYLYFGPAPAIFPWIPVYLLTGKTLYDQDLCYLLSLMGTACLIWLVIAICRQQKLTNLWAVFCVLLAMSFGTWITLLLRRPLFYEVAIVGAYFYTSLGILCLWQSIKARPSRSSYWKIASGLAFGMAVASRPFYGLAMLIPFWIWLKSNKTRSLDDNLKEGIKLAGSWFLCIIALAVYNYVRFDSIFETGFRYQLSGRDYHESYSTLWSKNHTLENIYSYFFKPISAGKLRFWEKSFGVASIYEDAYGIISNSPFCLWVLWFAFRLRKSRSWYGPYYDLICGIAIFTLCISVFIISFFISINRYMVDFAPWIMLLACLGFIQALQQAGHERTRRIIMASGVVLALWTVYVGLANCFCGFRPCESWLFPPENEFIR